MSPKANDEKDRMIAAASEPSVPIDSATGLEWRDFFERLGAGTLPSMLSSKAKSRTSARTAPTRIERAEAAADTTTRVAKALTEEETAGRREKSDRLRAARVARDATGNSPEEEREAPSTGGHGNAEHRA